MQSRPTAGIPDPGLAGAAYSLLVYGGPGAYKSFFDLEAAFGLAGGIPFAGKPVSHFSLAYVAAEGPLATIAGRNNIIAHLD
jgi:hypothetical protein